MNACPGPDPDLGVVRSVLGAVDCHARLYSEAGYFALTGPHSFFPAALTALLTIAVAILGFRLMFGLGRVQLSDAPMLAVKIGVILTLTLNWTTFQTLVFDLASRAPLEVAQIVVTPATGGAPSLANHPLDGLQTAYDQLALDASALGKQAGPNPQVLHGGEAAAADELWKAQGVLFMSTAGLIAVALIAVGVLTAIGPIFIALFLFEATRGLFVGWLRAIVAAALVPMLCWITTAVLLVVIDPWLVELAQSRDATPPDIETATITAAVIFIFGFAQAALIVGAGLIASGLALRPGRARATADRPAPPAPAFIDAMPRAERLAMELRRAALVRADRAEGPRGAAMRGGASSGTAASGGAASSPAGPVVARIGDSYRRAAHFDRFRKLDGRA